MHYGGWHISVGVACQCMGGGALVGVARFMFHGVAYTCWKVWLWSLLGWWPVGVASTCVGGGLQSTRAPPLTWQYWVRQRVCNGDNDAGSLKEASPLLVARPKTSACGPNLTRSTSVFMWKLWLNPSGKTWTEQNVPHNVIVQFGWAGWWWGGWGGDPVVQFRCHLSAALHRHLVNTPQRGTKCQRAWIFSHRFCGQNTSGWIFCFHPSESPVLWRKGTLAGRQKLLSCAISWSRATHSVVCLGHRFTLLFPPMQDSFGDFLKPKLS